MYKDAEEQRKCWNRWYRRNKEQEYQRVRDRTRELREWLQQLKTTLCCSRCPETHPACLDFHHRDASEKEISVANVTSQGWSKERILAEIAKCDVLCANCHRKEHNRCLVV